LRAGLILESSQVRARYHPHPFLDEGGLRNASKAAFAAIARAGAGTIFELAAWGLPAILIPLSHAAQDHQRANAYAYARQGGAVILEEQNLAPHIMLSELEKILKNRELRERMIKSAQAFARPDAAAKIAQEIIRLALAHS